MEFWLIWSLKTLKIIKEMWLNVFLKRFFFGGGDRAGLFYPNKEGVNNIF